MMVLLNMAQVKRLNMLAAKYKEYSILAMYAKSTEEKMRLNTLGTEILIHAEQVASTVQFGKERKR